MVAVRRTDKRRNTYVPHQIVARYALTPVQAGILLLTTYDHPVVWQHTRLEERAVLALLKMGLVERDPTSRAVRRTERGAVWVQWWANRN